jgi:catechol 2,3-dioxygenase-like lactoylglutathione lyase family enzyme
MEGRIHHIELYVSDLKRSSEFWGWFLGELGYTKYQEWDAGVSYRLDASYIVFVQVADEFRNPSYHRKHVGLNHLAFHADHRSDVDSMTAQLKERGATILYEDRHPHAGGEDSYAVFFEDPDRIKVELVVSG